jgi:hypothetical protein
MELPKPDPLILTNFSSEALVAELDFRNEPWNGGEDTVEALKDAWRERDEIAFFRALANLEPREKHIRHVDRTLKLYAAAMQSAA